jgi:hypothetical protein
MTITTCDICKKEISRGTGEISISRFVASPLIYVNASLCEQCGEPIAAFLRKHKLDSKEKPHPAA